MESGPKSAGPAATACCFRFPRLDLASLSLDVVSLWLRITIFIKLFTCVAGAQLLAIGDQLNFVFTLFISTYITQGVGANACVFFVCVHKDQRSLTRSTTITIGHCHRVTTGPISAHLITYYTPNPFINESIIVRIESKRICEMKSETNTSRRRHRHFSAMKTQPHPESTRCSPSLI